MEMIKDGFTDLELRQHTDETTILRPCLGCHEVIEPHSWYYVGSHKYSGKGTLHKFCAELSKKLTHPLHPEHLLDIKFGILHPHLPCNFCKRSRSGRLMYYCYKRYCEFEVDLMCAGDETLRLLASKSPEERERMVLKDLSHHHQLKLLHIKSRQDEEEDDEEEEDVVIIQHCKACLQPIVDSSYYICTEESEGCKYYTLHEFCAELPVEMKHELHPLHPLTLMLSPPLEHFKCYACGKFCQGVTYSCRICSFQLDIICATTKSRVLEHKCHQHPLMLLPMPISTFCRACCRVHDGKFYHCNTCEVFFIHEDCASHAYEINHSSHEGHTLKLGFPFDGSQQINECDVCDKPIYDVSGWFYYCWECKFYGHLNCISAGNTYKDQDTQEIDPEIPRLPWEEAVNEFGTVGLLKRKLSSNQDDREMDMIYHFSHPEHPLVLQSDLPKEVNPYSDGYITLATQCNGCCKQISAPLYSCADCHFYIHKGCALLQSSLDKHREHNHCRLVLLSEPWNETRVFKCDYCYQECNGFCYQCEDESCSYKIDVECAFLPITILHKTHPFHTLTIARTNNSEEGRIKCCSRNGGYEYRCDICNFRIHEKCAMYPSKFGHRFDCDTPFMLSFNPGELKPNEYHYCEICESRLDPKLWFYFSNKIGGQVMHHECLLINKHDFQEYPNFKSISSFLKGDIHHHTLHLQPTYTFAGCNYCKERMEDHNKNASDGKSTFYLAYQCVEWYCEYKIHVTCIKNIILQAKEACTHETIYTGIKTIASNIEQLYLEGSGSPGLGGKLDTLTLATSKGKGTLEQSKS